jgi:hypothetical protein
MLSQKLGGAPTAPALAPASLTAPPLGAPPLPLPPLPLPPPTPPIGGLSALVSSAPLVPPDCAVEARAGVTALGAALEPALASAGILGGEPVCEMPGASLTRGAELLATTPGSGAICPTSLVASSACIMKLALRATPTIPTTSARTPTIKLETTSTRLHFDQRRGGFELTAVSTSKLDAGAVPASSASGGAASAFRRKLISSGR